MKRKCGNFLYKYCLSLRVDPNAVSSTDGKKSARTEQQALFPVVSALCKDGRKKYSEKKKPETSRLLLAREGPRLVGPSDPLGVCWLFPVGVGSCEHGRPLRGSAGRVKVLGRLGKISVCGACDYRTHRDLLCKIGQYQPEPSSYRSLEWFIFFSFFF